MFKYLLFIAFFSLACNNNKSQSQVISKKEILPERGNHSSNTKFQNCNGNTIATRIVPLEDYHRVVAPAHSFASYLQSFKVLACNSKVKYYNGELKYNQNIHVAILDVSVGKTDLQQCADAVMRLRAEYLYKEKRYDEISFKFTNGWTAAYQKWRAGNNIVLKGNKSFWSPTLEDHTTRRSFELYLQKVFMFAGTYSLSKELKPQSVKHMEIGDVFIKGGFPGHAIIIVDMIINDKGEKMFLIAQSYMPAQQIHILINPSDDSISPWYSSTDVINGLWTPEWSFEAKHLMKF